MKTLALLLFQMAFFGMFAFAQQNESTKYFDIRNKPISEKKFKEQRATNQVLDIIGDSANHRKLIEREENGQFADYAKLISTLEKASGKKMGTEKPLVIIYYPGKDKCNETISLSNFASYYRGLQKKLDAHIIFVYKDFDGLTGNNPDKWIKDPEAVVEKSFFKHPYPCLSFVALSKTGKYSSYFGEFPPSFVEKAVKALQ
ncbi:hypothetical protein VRU48_01475 [Pedobacter sp. KR3-3]|uniref:Thioredoxin family protein n=1 Tax=Pedobacter albus TaxID=3113905 RepID=A0ABU7I2R0_9SPHI|nr:hypothetical protein [Pedobacter sp. KR3-3]MEE1943757.1 hypothetical protein [Pedobacter sp. KR3-3]